MTHSRERRQKKVGRPPAGERGERVTDYPQLSVRMPRAARDKLKALSRIRKQPQWRLIVECVECYLSDLSPDEQQVVTRLLEAERKRHAARRAP